MSRSINFIFTQIQLRRYMQMRSRVKIYEPTDNASFFDPGEEEEVEETRARVAASAEMSGHAESPSD